MIQTNNSIHSTNWAANYIAFLYPVLMVFSNFFNVLIYLYFCRFYSLSFINTLKKIEIAQLEEDWISLKYMLNNITGTEPQRRPTSARINNA